VTTLRGAAGPGAGPGGAPVLVLLTGPLAPPAGVRALAAALGRVGPVLDLPLTPDGSRPADLGAPARAVLAALTGAGHGRALLCGVGFGALVALQVARSEPERTAALVLASRVPPLAGAVRSLGGGVAGLLPAHRLQRLGRRPALLALERVRAVDSRLLTPGVRTPALVLAGERAPEDRRCPARGRTGSGGSRTPGWPPPSRSCAGTAPAEGGVSNRRCCPRCRHPRAARPDGRGGGARTPATPPGPAPARPGSRSCAS